MSFTLPLALAEQLSELAQRREQTVEQVLSNLLAAADTSGFFDISLEMLCIANTDGRYLRLNRAFCDGLGYSEAELLATPFLTLVHPDDLSDTQEALERLRGGQPTIRFVNRYRCADGAYKWLSWTSAPLADGRIYTTAHDITRQKQLEADLTAQANTVRTILASITDAFFALDNQWRFTYVNEEAETLLRTSSAALLGKVVWDQFPEAISSKFYRQYHKVLETGTATTFTAYYPPFETWFEVRAYPSENGISVYFRDVTERRRAEEKLRQREQEFRALVENNPDLIARLNRDLRLEFINPAMARMINLEVSGKINSSGPLGIKADAAVLARLYETARAVFETGEERWLQIDRPLGPDSGYFETRIVPEFGPDGTVETILTISRDITERRRTEQALRESEALFRAIVESQIDMVCRYYPDTILIYANDAYCRFFGQPREALLGRSYLPLVAPETHEPIRERIAQVLRDPRPEVREFTAFAADGSRRWIQWVDHGIVNEDGQVVMIQAVGRDITRVKEAETALQHKEEQYRLLFDNNPVPMWVYDTATLRFLTVNEAAIAQYGYSREEFLKLRITDLSLPEDRARLARIISGLKPGRSAPVEWRQLRRDGTTMDMEIFGHDVMFEGRPARMALARDVTQRRQLEEQRLYTQTLELELAKQRELAELRERFMSMVSHEFRTPLAIISSSVDIVQHYFDRIPREKIAERLSDINQQVFSMVSLLEDVLTVLRGNAGKLMFTPEALDVVGLCGHTVENIRLTDRGQHELVFETETPALPIEADRRLLEHIVTNLITNAVKYSPPGTRIRMIVRPIEGGVLLAVEDQGIGIPQDDQPYVFQPFHRARNAASVDGTGLGLSIVKQNVELHGGQISFQSTENQGTTFIVQLPRVVPTPATTSA